MQHRVVEYKIYSSPLHDIPFKADVCIVPTRILLQHPAFELYDGVGEGAAVLALAAVANLVATHVKLAERVQRSHLTVAHVGRPHHVHQAPAADTPEQPWGFLRSQRTKWKYSCY